MYSEFKCTICEEYLLDGALQCSCGDRICTSCFKSISSSRKSKFTCPRCEEEVSVKDCFKDKAILNELKKARISCTSVGCNWQGQSSEYRAHKEICNYVKVSCPYQKCGCPHEISRSELSSHAAACDFKPKQCPWCSKLMENEEVHLKHECSLISVLCSNGCGEKIPKKDMENHKKTACTHQMKECEFKEYGCEFKGGREELERHVLTDVADHLRLTGDYLKAMEKTLDAKLMKTAEQMSDLMSEINHVNREISVKLQPVASAVGNAETAIQNLQEGFSELALMVQTLQATSYNGTFIWKIPEVQRRRHEAKIGKTISLYSAPFYTSRQGYKACLRLYMDGDGCGKNTHLSLFVTIMKGEYDALLQWPFRQTVTLTLLDQDGVKNISQAFQPEPTSSSFKRPRNEMNIASGCPMFAPLSVLNNSSYVKEDTMFLKCEIDTSGIRLP